MLKRRIMLPEQWADVHVKLAIIVWGIVYTNRPPQAIVSTLGWTLVYATSVLACLGSVVGITGLLMSNSKSVKRRYQGNLLEFSGLIVAASGPFTYFATVAYLTVELTNPQGYSFAAISYALCASLISRILLVRRGLKGAD